MRNKRVVDQVTEIALPIVENQGLELVEAEYVKEGPNWFLRVYIDKPSGVNIDDCQIISEQLSDILDIKDPIPDSYILEVSSPGLDRPLKTDRDFEKYKGEEVEVKFFKAIKNKQIVYGNLIEKTEDMVWLELDGLKEGFNLKDIAVIKRTIKF